MTDGLKLITQRPQPCIVCGKIVPVESASTCHPEAPEMLRLPPGASIGFVTGDIVPEMIIACSEACLTELLSE